MAGTSSSDPPGSREPLGGPHAWYVLMELADTSRTGLAQAMADVLEGGFAQSLIEDAAQAQSLAQRAAFWALRENLSDVQKLEGGSIKHDISVAIADVPEFLRRAEIAVTARVPGARMLAFGHLGDGNVHCNVSQPVGADTAAFLARWHEVNAIVHGIVADMGGSVSAEHGIGVLKRDLLVQVKDPVALEVMRALKAVLDPRGVLNPGKVL